MLIPPKLKSTIVNGLFLSCLLLVTNQLIAQNCTCTTTLGSPGTTTTFESLVIAGDLPSGGSSTGITYCIEGKLVIESADPITS